MAADMNRRDARAQERSPWRLAAIEERGLAGWLVANVVVAALYFLLGIAVARFFATYGLFPAPIWLPASIAMVAAMVGGPRLFPGIFLGSLLTNDLLFAPAFYITVVISITNGLGPVIGAVVLRRLRPRGGLFTSFAGVLAFLVCTTFLNPAITATGGGIAETLGHPDLSLFYSICVNWWLSDSGGTLYLAPALILWLGLEQEPELQMAGALGGFSRRDLAVWGWIALVSVILFLTPPLRGTYIRSAFPFLLVVPLSWIALRMSLRSAYTLVSLVAIVATAGTVAGFGPFQNHALANPLQLVGTLVVLLAMNVLTIVALMSERREAENANKVKSMFLAKTSHELRTPLNAIIGFSSLINAPAREPLSEKKYGDYARLIQSSGEHLLALIDDLLEMAKIEAGRLELREERMALATAVEDAVALIAIPAEAKSIKIATGGLNDLIVNADPKVVRQILLNLLSNAVKFTPEGGEIGVTVTLDEHGDVAIRVSDTGVGIPADSIERVFHPFERVRGDANRKIEGTGLGLSITRGLVRLHDGEITLQSRVGEGTIVTVVLPAERIVGNAQDRREGDDPPTRLATG
ncbi:MAG TPA: ATP-binding protein [Stellaceae bacterium]|nr:ATP-binding protein [Stellaceae bacterium]